MCNFFFFDSTPTQAHAPSSRRATYGEAGKTDVLTSDPNACCVFKINTIY